MSFNALYGFPFQFNLNLLRVCCYP